MTRFLLILLGILAITAGAHYLILDSLNVDTTPLLLWQSYLANALLAVAGFILLKSMSERMGGQLAYLFLGYGLVKFGVFFLFFRPTYMLDEDVSKMEFFAFFIPYILALVVEIAALSRILKEKDEALKKLNQSKTEENTPNK